MPTPKQGYRDADGNSLPGVTTILRQVDVQFLIVAANKMGLKGREVYGANGEWTRAADIGTCAHARIEAFIRKEAFGPEQAIVLFKYEAEQSVDLFNSSQPAFDSFLAWAGSREFMGRTEVGLVHSQGFGGTIDYLVMEGCEVYGWKTSKQLGASAIAQVCGGYSMLCEETLFVPNRYHVVRFPKEGGEAEQWTIHGGSPTAINGRVMFQSLLASYKATAEIEAVNKIRTKNEKVAA